MPDLLVTLCNLPQPRETALLRIGLKTGVIEPVPLGATTPVKTCTGLTMDATRIFVICADADVKSYLAVLNRADLAPLSYQFLPEVIDGHSILVKENRLFVVSTGNDAVFAYDMTAAGASNPALVWNIPDHSGTHHDTHHLNSIASRNGEIVFSAFGPKTGQTWSTATEGYLFNVNRNAAQHSGIYQPHSLREWQGELYYCESARGTVASANGILIEIGDYTRGLDFIGHDTIAVGSSVGRKVSKSTGFINNPGDPGARSGSCEVGLFRLAPGRAPERTATFPLGEFGPEIYDLLYLGDAQGETERPGAIFAHAAPLAIRADAGQGDGALLERHQIISELDRARELKERELRTLSEAAAALQAAIEERSSALGAIERELEQKAIALSRLSVREAQSAIQPAPPAPITPADGWLTRLFRKRN